ncbi:MAG: M16 family metallopeptidase, partial [Burkholderiales bacterium]
VLEREKARTIAALRDAQTRPAAIAERDFRRLVFGGHPYGLPPYGEPETVATIDRDDLKQFHSKFYLARKAVIAMIGDVSRREAERIAEMLTAGLPNSRRAAAALPPVAPLAKSVERVIAHSATQAYIRMGMPGMRRGDPEYFALWLGNHVLGGNGFSSRLTIELREKRGLTYSASSYFSPFAQPGPYVLELQTRKDQAWEALEVLRQTFEKFVAEGPSEQELEAAKQNVIGGFVLRIDSNGKILEYLSLLGFYRLPLDYIDRFPERISALTLTEVRDAFRRRVDPARMITVVVGPENKP